MTLADADGAAFEAACTSSFLKLVQLLRLPLFLVMHLSQAVHRKTQSQGRCSAYRPVLALEHHVAFHASSRYRSVVDNIWCCSCYIVQPLSIIIIQMTGFQWAFKLVPDISLWIHVICHCHGDTCLFLNGWIKIEESKIAYQHMA